MPFNTLTATNMRFNNKPRIISGVENLVPLYIRWVTILFHSGKILYTQVCVRSTKVSWTCHFQQLPFFFCSCEDSWKNMWLFSSSCRCFWNYFLKAVEPHPNANVKRHMIWWKKEPSETAPDLKNLECEIRGKALLLSMDLEDKTQNLMRRSNSSFSYVPIKKISLVATKAAATLLWSLITHLWMLLSIQLFLHNPKHIVTISDLILRSHGGNSSFILPDLLDEWALQNCSPLAAINKRYI